jgi:single-strand DNA-binding protein
VVSGRLEQRSWETGREKRSIVEVVADDIAPSLRFATAEIHRSAHPGPGQVGGGGDTNSTDGSEPTHQHTRGDANYDQYGEEPF